MKYTNATTNTLVGALTFTADTSAGSGWTGYQTAGGTFQYNGGGLLTFSTGGLVPTAGEGNISLGSGGTLTFGLLGARGAGAGINFVPGTGAIAFTAAVAGANGIVGGFATINGTDFVASVGAGGSVAIPSYTVGGAVFNSTFPTSTAGSSSVNYLSNGSNATSVAVAANTLKINHAGTLSLGGALTITSASATSLGGILFDGSSAAGGISSQSITTSAAGQELVIYNSGANPFTLSTILNNGAGAVTKSGNGTLIVTNAAAVPSSTNTADSASVSLTVGSVSGLYVGMTLSGTGVSGAPQITAIAGNVLTLSAVQTIAANAALTFTPQNAFTGTLTINEGTVKPTGAFANLLGAIPAAGTTVIRQLGTLDINDAGLVTPTYTGSSTSLPTVNIGALSGGGSTSPSTAAQTTITGAGGVTNGTSFTVSSTTGIAVGETVIGLTTANGSPNSTTAVVTGINTGTGVITVSSPITLANNANVNFVANTTSGATVINNGVAASAVQINSTAAGIYTGVIKDGTNQLTLIKAGSGTETLTGLNTYTGPTVITAGILSVYNLASGGLPSGIGASSNAASNLIFNGGTLQYTANNGATLPIQFTETPSVAIDRLFTIAASGSGIDSSGSFGNNFLSTLGNNNAALVFSNTGTVQYVNTNVARTFTLTGTSTGDNEMDVKLVDNGTGPLSITKSAAGQWLLPNTNTYTGTTSITGGILVATEGVGLPTTSNLLISGGVLQTSGTFIRGLGTAAGSDTVQFVAGTDGFAASSSKLTVALGGLAAPTQLTWGTAPFALTTLQLGSTTSAAETEFRNPIDLGNATRTVNVSGSGSTNTAFSTISGVLSNSTGVGNLALTGAGTLQLTGANTYNGTTLLNTASSSETLMVNSVGNSVNGTAGTSLGAANGGAVILGNGSNAATMIYVGSGETATRAVQLGNTSGGISIDASGTGALILTNVTNTGSGAKTLSLTGNSTDLNTISSVLADNGGALGVTKTTPGNAGGTWVLTGANTFTGIFSMNQGFLGVGNAQALGLNTTAAAFTLNNGNVFFTNGVTSVNNNIQLTNGTQAFTGTASQTWNGTFLNSGGNNTLVNTLPAGQTLTFSGVASLQDGTNARTLNVTGTGATVFSGIVQNGGTAAGGINLNAPGGSLTLSGSSPNTYTGATTITNGTLILAKAGALGGTGSTFALNGGALTVNTDITYGGTSTMGITVGTGTVLGGPNSLTFTGIFGNVSATEVLTNNLIGGSGNGLTLSGTFNLDTASTNAQSFFLYGSGTTNITGSIQPSRLSNSNLFYEGTGMVNIATTVANGTSGTLVINGGTVDLAGSSANTSLNFTNVLANNNGTLKLDNTNFNANYRAGAINTGAALSAAAVGTGVATTITLAGGTLSFIANASGSNENETVLNLGNGGSNISFTNAGLVNSSLTFANFTQAAGSTAMVSAVSGTLGTTDKILLGLASSNPTTGVGNAGILQRILVGTDFATYDQNTGIVAFSNYNTANNLDSASPLDTLKLTTTPTFTGATSGMVSGTAGGVAYGLGKTINALDFGANSVTAGSSSLKELVISSGGILANGTGDVLTAKWLALGGVEGVVHVTGTNDLTINAVITGTAGLTKADNGKLVLTGQQLYSGATTVNGGILQLGTGVSTPVTPTVTLPTVSALNVNNGTFDLNGNSALVGAITTNNSVNGFSELPNASAFIDNSAAGTNVNLISAGGNNTNNTFSGVIEDTGAGAVLNLYKTGNATLTSGQCSDLRRHNQCADGHLAIARQRLAGQHHDQC